MLKIGTRKSALALWQAERVQGWLRARGEECELLPMSTEGDRILDRGRGVHLAERDLQRKYHGQPSDPVARMVSNMGIPRRYVDVPSRAGELHFAIATFADGGALCSALKFELRRR